MADYIDREAFIIDQCHSCDGACEKIDCDATHCSRDCRCDMIMALAEFPAADVVERKRGEWIEKALDTYRKYSVTCPFCGAEYIDNYDGYVDTGNFNYCPNCGADMRGEGDG